jgi:hypothetical protein
MHGFGTRRTTPTPRTLGPRNDGSRLAWPATNAPAKSEAAPEVTISETASKPGPHHWKSLGSAGSGSRPTLIRNRRGDSGSGNRTLCLNRKARFVPSTDSSAQMSPTPTDSETPVTGRPSSERSQNAKALPPKRDRRRQLTARCPARGAHRSGARRRAAYFPRHRAHARAERDDDARRPLARPPRR